VPSSSYPADSGTNDKSDADSGRRRPPRALPSPRPVPIPPSDPRPSNPPSDAGRIPARISPPEDSDWGLPPELAPDEFTPAKAIGSEITPDKYPHSLPAFVDAHAKALLKRLPRNALRMIKPLARVGLKAVGKGLDHFLTVCELLDKTFDVVKEYLVGGASRRPRLQMIQSIGVDGLVVSGGIAGGYIGAQLGEAVAVALASLFGLTGVGVTIVIGLGFVGFATLFAALGGLVARSIALLVYTLTRPASTPDAKPGAQTASASRPPVAQVTVEAPAPPRHDNILKKKPDLYPPYDFRGPDGGSGDDNSNPREGGSGGSSVVPPPPSTAPTQASVAPGGIFLEVRLSEKSFSPQRAADVEPLHETKDRVLRQAAKHRRDPDVQFAAFPHDTFKER
jgi:hypothetical protein